MYLGDFKEDGDLFFKFTTRAFATGIPTVLAGTPVLSVFIDENTTGKTTAEAYFDLDVSLGSIVGYNNVRIDLSGDAFFATGADYAVVITTGTVGGVSVVGEMVGHFSIENRSMGQPAGATLAADIAAIKAETVLILADTDDIGVAGAGLTDLGGMSTGMKGEVESEANDALVAQKLDHLIAVAEADDPVDNSIIAKLANSGATADWSAYVNTTDSLMAIRDHIGDGTNLTEVGGDGDHLTAINLPNQTMDITGNLSGSVGSVTGAVGSVAGNVDGSVASVTAEVTADITKISGSATAANKLEEGAEALAIGTVNDAGASTTVFKIALTGDTVDATDDHYNGRIITFTSGALLQQSTDITDYDGGTTTVTVTALTSAPANGVQFVIS